MDNKMFCFQCEQTAGCTGCTGRAGVCGKTSDVAKLQDELTGALVGLAHALDTAPEVNEGTWQLIIEGLFTTVTNVSFNEKHCASLSKGYMRKRQAFCPAVLYVPPHADGPMIMIWKRSGMHRRIFAVSSHSSSSAYAVWQLMHIMPWYWDIPMKK